MIIYPYHTQPYKGRLFYAHTEHYMCCLDNSNFQFPDSFYIKPGCVAQSVTCLVTDACLTTDLGVPSLIPARSHTYVEIGHEINSTVIHLPSAESFKKGCCQLQAKVCAGVLGNCLFKLGQEKVWLGELTILP